LPDRSIDNSYNAPSANTITSQTIPTFNAAAPVIGDKQSWDTTIPALVG
jgi:hypothetical protein